MIDKRAPRRVSDRRGGYRILIGSDRRLGFAAGFASRRIPGSPLPELFQIRLTAAENVPLRLLNIGDAYWIGGPRSRAFAVATILPERPIAPRRGWTRLVTIIRHPQPTLR